MYSRPLVYASPEKSEHTAQTNRRREQNTQKDMNTYILNGVNYFYWCAETQPVASHRELDRAGRPGNPKWARNILIMLQMDIFHHSQIQATSILD